jgi:hypothetical protein
MTTKCFAGLCMLLGLLAATNVASARWSRGECTDAADQKFGQKHMSHHAIDAAVHRCLRRGPGAV